MNQEQQYYTPSIEDFFVGYEYEILNGKEWVKCVFGDSNSELYHNELSEVWQGEVRTPFLTKEQIIAEGWEYEKTSEGGYDLFVRGKCSIIHSNRFKRTIISIQESQEISHNLFLGYTPSINELRSVQKLIPFDKLRSAIDARNVCLDKTTDINKKYLSPDEAFKSE